MGPGVPDLCLHLDKLCEGLHPLWSDGRLEPQLKGLISLGLLANREGQAFELKLQTSITPELLGLELGSLGPQFKGLLLARIADISL